MNKQELIKQAYGESWSLCEPFTDENGFCVVFKDSDHKFKGVAGNQTHFKEHEIEGGQMTHSVHGKGISFRPKTLSGIEHNNGWTKIESENDLPDEGAWYRCVIDCFYWTDDQKIKIVFRDLFLDTKSDNDGNPIWLMLDSGELSEEIPNGSVTHYKQVKEDLPPLY